MTFPITTTGPLWNELCKVSMSTPLTVKLRDGREWQLDGVEPLVDENERTIGFELIVGPKEP